MNSYLKLLLTSYILMLLPQVLTATVLGRGKITILYFACYLISSGLLLLYVFKRKVKVSKKDFLLFICYVIILSATFISNIFLNIDTQFNDFADFIIKILNILIYYCFVPKNEIIKDEDLKRFFSYIVLIGCLSCIYNIVVNFSVIKNFYKITNSYTVNLCGFFANRNTYGQFLFICILSNLYLLKNNDGEFDKKYVIVLFVLLINLIFTMSRGSLVATLILLYFYFYKSSKNKTKMVITTLLTILFICVIALSNSKLLDFINNNFIRSSVGTTGRSSLWKIGLSTASSNFLNGIGYYTALNLTGRSQFHSFFVDTITESGIIGLLFKVGLIYSVYLKIRQANRQNESNYYYLMKSAFISLLFIAIIESINFFLLGFTENQITIFFVTLPLLLIQKNENMIESSNVYNENISK